jgi:DNA-binding transcriptional regulator YiaG
MKQMNEIVRGMRAPSREFYVDAVAIKSLRSTIGLSQPKFAALLQVDVGTLRNWEQGGREPTGPEKAACAHCVALVEIRPQRSRLTGDCPISIVGRGAEARPTWEL